MTINSPKIIIVGVGGHAVSAWDLANQMNAQVCGFLNPIGPDAEIAKSILESGISILTSLSQTEIEVFQIFVAVGDNLNRSKIVRDLKNRGVRNFPNLVAHSASVSSSVAIGEGNFIGNQVNVGAGSIIGNFSILNSGSSTDHECQISDFVSISPGVIVGGRVEIGSGTFIGMNSTVRQNVSIGENCLIGATSYVNRSLESNIEYWGIPVRKKRLRNLGARFNI